MTSTDSNAQAAETAPADAPAKDAQTALGTAKIAAFAMVSFELALAVFLIHRFNIESDAFHDVALFALGGFFVHHFLPQRVRMPFFLALSLGALLWVAGLEDGEWVARGGFMRAGVIVLVGVGLVGICHLPFSYWVRVAMLVAAGTLLAVFRSGVVEITAFNGTWAVLGTMFMFRLMVYLYDIEHEKERSRNVSRSLAYFFLLPNACFPLFPVIDYRTFCRSHYNDEAITIYQKGLSWIFRGIIQLLIWRLVYYHFYLAPTNLSSGTDVIRYMVGNMLLYLRVSGQFHLVIGLIHLFGFNLPETNRRYFFASSVLDYWRRVNIYWKDFMMKIFYYPATFRMKRLGPTQSLIWATVFTFIVTWALHSYQWFWIRGDFPITAQDVLFWAIFGAVVVGNSIVEMKKGRKRQLGKRAFTAKDAAVLGIRTALIFTLLTTLWSLWSCDSVSVWLAMWSYVDWSTLAWALLTMAIVGGSAILIEGILGSGAPAPTLKKAPFSFPWRAAIATCVVPGLFIYTLSSGRVMAAAGLRLAPYLASLSYTKPNLQDQAAMERGYYENVMNPNKAGVDIGHPKEFKRLDETNAVRPSHDFRWQELNPSTKTVINGKTITVNQWGMRDKEYAKAKPPDTYRIALLGSSHVMGWGVEEDERFETIIEDRLNQEFAGKPWAHYEILDFAVNGYSPICQLGVLDQKVFDFNPDAVWFVAHTNDPFWAMQRFGKSYRLGTPPPYEFLKQLGERAGITEKTPEMQAQTKLNPYWPEMLQWTYQQIADRARAHGAQPVFIFLPAAVTERGERFNDSTMLIDFGAKSGFVELLLGDVYKNYKASEIAVASFDAHPNAKGQRIVADALYEAIKTNPDLKIFKRGTP